MNKIDNRLRKSFFKYGYEYILVEVKDRTNVKPLTDAPNFMWNFGWALKEVRKVK